MRFRSQGARRAWLRLRRVVRETERGATAVVVALSLTLLMAAGAFGFDVAKLYYERQQLRNAIDAAAQAGASALPSTGDAQQLAITYGNLNFPGLGLTTADIKFFCVVKNTAGTAAGGIANAAEVGDGGSYTCQGKPGWTNSDAKCSDTSCAIPCDVGQRCNSMQIKKERQVQFVFGPAINIDHASTGAVTTLSCKGACGDEATPNPMNVVVMADRTPSMWGTWDSVGSDGRLYGASGSNTNLNALKSGIKSMLNSMNPDQQYVAFGGIHKSAAAGSIDPLGSGAKILTETAGTKNVPYCSKYDRRGRCTTWSSQTVDTTTPNDVFTGAWVPIGFSKDYQSPSSALYTNVSNMTFSNLTTSGTNGTTARYVFNSLLDSDGNYSDAGTGTHLASALKGAAQYLLTKVDADNMVPTLDDGTRAALNVKPRNVIILETDGEPSEVLDNAETDSAPALSLGNGDDVGAGRNTSQACKNLNTIATQAKAAGITIITIAYGSALSGGRCSSTQTAAQALAQAASTQASVTGSGTASADCDQENSDDDYFYCASNNSQLQNVFAAAMGSMTGSTKFMSIPGVGD